MNKLIGLMGERTGKRTEYEKLREATKSTTTYGGRDDVNEEDHLKSDDDADRKSVVYFCGKNIGWVILLVLVIVLSAMSGQIASSQYRPPEGRDDEVIEPSHSIPYRPCQAQSDSGFIKLMETSRSQASRPWAEQPCLIHFSNNNNRNSDDKDSYFRNNWNYWLFGNDNNNNNDERVGKSGRRSEAVEYGMASAEIRVDFDRVAFADREPILGFGGAFTEASALNWKSLTKEGQDAVLELLFGKTGLGYSLGRVHMNSCDFCVSSYSFDDVDGDFDLDHFDSNVTHDVTSGMIPFMLQAQKLLHQSWGTATAGPGGDGHLRIMASPWSPPAWMKDPHVVPYGDLIPISDDDKHAEGMTSSALPTCLLNGTQPQSQYAKTWALYFDKFITAYKEKGLKLFAVTVQNEPEFPAPWEACAFDPYNERDFVANFLGPQLSQNHPDVKLFIFDHNKDHAPKWAQTILSNTSLAAPYVHGTALHWYAGGMDRLLDGALGTPNFHRLLHILQKEQVSPDHLILGSEACHCPSTSYAGGDVRVGWARAERYAHTVLADLAAGSNGWIEWNLILDAYGGPNHLGNMCDSPLLAVPYRDKQLLGLNISKRASFEDLIEPFGPTIGDDRTREELHAFGNPAHYLDKGIVVQPMYHYMGHISRYVRPGSKAVPAIVNQPTTPTVTSNNNAAKNSDESSNNRRKNSPLRTFRSVEDETAGGGINDLARNGIEVTTWPCEGSTRQLWQYLPEQKYLQVHGHDWLGNPTTSCLSKQPDDSLGGLTLTSCPSDNESTSDNDDVAILQFVNNDSSSIRMVVTNSEEGDGQNCLIIKPLENGGGALGLRGGSQVSVGKCSNDVAKWEWDQTTGEIMSYYFSSLSLESNKIHDNGPVCMTTGWPFLQVGAFITPNADGHEKVIVILNEAEEPANFIIRNDKDNQVLVTSSIRPHAIQTLLFD